MTKSMQLAINCLIQELCLIVTAKVCSKLSVLDCPAMCGAFLCLFMTESVVEKPVTWLL